MNIPRTTVNVYLDPFSKFSHMFTEVQQDISLPFLTIQMYASVSVHSYKLVIFYSLYRLHNYGHMYNYATLKALVIFWYGIPS